MQPRPNQRLAVVTAMVGYTVALGAAGLLTRHETALLGREEQWRTDRWNEFYGAVGLYVVLMVVLVWLGFLHRPTHGEPSPPFPPLVSLATLGGLAVVWWNIGDYLTKLSAILLGGMLAAAGWTVVLVACRPRAEPADQPLETVPTDPRTVAAPEMLVVKPRARAWWFWGWVAGGVVWGALGVSVASGPYPDARGVPVGVAGALVCWGVAALGLRPRLTADRDGIHMSDLFRTKYLPWTDITDVDLEQDITESGQSRDRWHLVICTTKSERVTAEGVDNGPFQPGSTLDLLRAQLLAMRSRYLSPP